MSLRPEISGFDLGRMRSYLGCGDPAVAERAAVFAREFWIGDEELDQIAAHARDIVDGTATERTVNVERSAFVGAVISLAHFEQEHLPTDSNLWKSVHLDWCLDLPEDLPGADPVAWADARYLVECAVLQRPMFGEVQESDWTTYGFLTRDEVRRLLDYRTRFPRLGRDEHEFAPEFFGWLDKISAADLDYWFVAQ